MYNTKSQVQSSQIDSISHISQQQDQDQTLKSFQVSSLNPLKHCDKQIDVMFELPGSQQRQIVRKVKSLFNQNGDLILRPIIYNLKQKGYNIQGNLVAFWSKSIESFVHCGNDPLPSTAHIPFDQYEGSDRIILKFKTGLRAQQKAKQQDQAAINNANSISLSKRTKQRKIGYIIERVSLWRKLYNGLPDGEGNIIRYSLEDSAQKVGISKKSLDDYLLQLRFGRKFGFNFNTHKDSKVGALRAYVKKHKMQAQKKKK